jgi:signal transduction histidine kinase
VNTNESLKKTLLKALGIYRVCSLVAVLILMRTLNNVRDVDFSPIQINYALFLFGGTIAYFFLVSRSGILAVLLNIEYFVVFFFAYIPPNHLYMEFIWIPCIIAAQALILSGWKSLIFIAAYGIMGPLLFSYGRIYNINVSIGEIVLPFSVIILCEYIPVMLLAIFAKYICFQLETVKQQYLFLESENKKFNEINHAISQRIFNLQNDITQKERNRLSKEIHDTAGYVFVNLIMMLQATLAILRKDIDKADRLISDARDYAERGINEIRHLLRGIRNYTPAWMSLQNELHNVGESFQKATNVEIIIDYGTWSRTLSKDLDSFFISFMQEALTNALKHGNASTVSVLCCADKTHLAMTITDNGCGARLPIKKGIGITAMEDVASALGGCITIKTSSAGFRITASIHKDAGSPLPDTRV